MAKSDFGTQILVTNKDGVTFDLNKNYSTAIAAAKAAGQDTTQLERERQAKINSAAYGGKEKTGSQNATLGNVYSDYSTIGNRTSTGSPIVVTEKNPMEFMDFDEFLNNMGYDSYQEQTRKYIQDAVNNAVKGYESQIADVNADTKELARQAYVNKMMGEKNLDQQLAASGMAGGMADSQRIGLQANYENNLVALEQQRADTVRELERAIENARLTGDMQTAQELASYLQQVQGQWNSYVQNRMAMENQNYWNRQNMETEAANKARNWALTLLESGSMPDDATLTAAGISRTEADSLLQQVLAAQRRSNYVAPTPEPTVEDNLIAAISALSQNTNLPMNENEVRSLWNSGYDFSKYATAIPALAQYLGTSATGVEAREYENLLNRLNLAMSEETKANAGRIVTNLIDKYWEKLNNTQQQEVDNLIRRYGFNA